MKNLFLAKGDCISSKQMEIKMMDKFVTMELSF